LCSRNFLSEVSSRKPFKNKLVGVDKVARDVPGGMV
jgi:hypothetical protein